MITFTNTQALRLVQASTAKHDVARPQLEHILLDFDAKKMVGTDGVVATMAPLDYLEQDSHAGQVLIKLPKIPKHKLVKVDLEAGKAWFGSKSVLIEIGNYTYPEYQRIIQSKFNTHPTIDGSVRFGFDAARLSKLAAIVNGKIAMTVSDPEEAYILEYPDPALYGCQSVIMPLRLDTKDSTFERKG